MPVHPAILVSLPKTQTDPAALYRAKREGRNRVETIASVESLRAASDHFGDTTRVRLMRLIGSGDKSRRYT